MKNVLVIYHGHCYDGFTAAWVAYRYFKEKGVTPVFYGAKYQTEPPNCKDMDVFILDFSYPRKTLIKMNFEAKSLLVLDHHETAEANLKGLSYAVFDMEQSGAGLAWNWFFAGKTPPLMLTRVEDRDLWRFHYDDTPAAQGYLGTIEQTFENWDEVMQDGIFTECIVKGQGVVDYIAIYGKKSREHARIEKISGFYVPTMNMPYMNCSEHLHALLEAQPHPAQQLFVASYFRTGEGEWQFSLRSKGEFNVSTIAKSFGGGGHRNSAGFTVGKLPWEPEGSHYSAGPPPTPEAQMRPRMDDKK